MRTRPRPPPTYSETSPAKVWCSAFLYPHPPISPWGKWVGDCRGAAAWPQPPLPCASWGCRHLFTGPDPMNPAPNALHLDPQRGVGWYGVAQTMTLHLLAIQFSLANPRALSWLQMSSPVLPDPPGPLWRRAFAPLPQMLPSLPSCLPCGVELPGASSSWRACCWGFPLGFLSAQRASG